jgi:hypothetical protein
MAEKKEEEKKEAESGEKEKKKQGIDDYLQSPRKKRKNYVVLAYSRFLSPELASSIQSFLKTTFPNLTLAYPRTEQELVRNFTKQIKLLIIDDEFCSLEEGMNVIKLMKVKKYKNQIPVLFLTARPGELIKHYNETLLPFHELDEYIDYTRVSSTQVLSKIRNGLVSQNRRRSRRYQVDIPLKYSSLSHNKEMEGRLVDLSLHGAMLKSEGAKTVFNDQEQIKIRLPLGKLNPAQFGDFLHLSAKVRRVQISGEMAGISFEYMSEKQLMILTYYLTNMVNTQVAHQARVSRAKMGR